MTHSIASQCIKVNAAINELADGGIEVNVDEETCLSIANAGFDSRTLPQSLVLAQILEENEPISVRGAFYRAVSAGIYPNTDPKYYRQVQNIVLKLRRCGAVPYSWISDSTRIRTKPGSWSGLADFGEACRNSYRKDFWGSQKSYVEVVTEKDAMMGVLEPITEEYDVYINVIRGNSSDTHIWNLAESLRRVQKPIHIFYFGDYDPNGLDIERDLKKRLTNFLPSVTSLFWQRMAITPTDFRRADLIGFPIRPSTSKGWKSRCDKYKSEHGNKCLEVDAIKPAEIRERLEQAIQSHIDMASWQRLRAIEKMELETISQAFGGGRAHG